MPVFATSVFTFSSFLTTASVDACHPVGGLDNESVLYDALVRLSSWSDRESHALEALTV
jgi:hypothetical protein